MDSLFLFFFFILGLVFGSFLTVVGLRIPQNKTFIKGRSQCPHCHKYLHWNELIPIFSYIRQKGKCRQCRRRISFLYPFIELTTGVLFAYSYYIFSVNIELIMALFLLSLLVIVFITDIFYMVIPNKVLLFYLPIFIIIRFIQPLEPWWSPLAGVVAAFLLLSLIILISRGGMGGGDLKLFTLLGVVLGFEKVLFSFLLACVFGALVGVGLLALGKLKKNEPMPFAPYIALGSLVAYFHGDAFVDWYLNLFNLSFGI